MENLKLNIVTPYGMIFSDEIQSVVLPGSEGEFGVYAGHCDLLASLKAGVVELTKADGDIEMVAINWGYAQVDSKKVQVIADGAVPISGGSQDKIASAIESARQLLEEASDDRVAISSVVSRIESGAKSKL